MIIHWSCTTCPAQGQGLTAAERHVKDTQHGYQTSSIGSPALPLCTCGHRKNRHQYRHDLGNVGRCLARECGCGVWEAAA